MVSLDSVRRDSPESSLASPLAEGVYQRLVDGRDEAVCSGISEEACRQTPANFVRILTAQFLSKLGDEVASPKTVLAWVTGAVGAPGFVLGLLVPLREAGSLIPQLAIAGVVRRLAVRKWVWVMGSLVQAASVVGLGATALLLSGALAGWAILGLLGLFSLARGFCSVASKDVLGKTVPETRRGQLTGWSAGAAGLVTLGVGATLLLPALQAAEAGLLPWLLAGGGLLWIAAAAIYGGVAELPGETASAGAGWVEALASLRILLDDRPFRRFVMARALLMCSALSAPYYVALAQQRISSAPYLLGMFVLGSGLARLLSGPVWGRLADRSSPRVMTIGAVVTAAMGLLTFAADRWLPSVAATVWFLPGAYFALSVAHSGVRVGRKTYVVDLASGNRRTDYVAVSNTVIGILLLVVGSLGAFVPFVGHAGIIALLALMGAGGAWLSATLTAPRA